MFKKLFRRKKEPKVFVIGLDCAPPELLFEAWRHELPNFKKLIDGGAYSQMFSSTPAITVPAWSSMTSSKDPQPVPISSTFVSFLSEGKSPISASVIEATTYGWEIVCPWPIGSAVSS
jgi:predicted AlkP superfamily phosphohydrolase/phosphomutase